MVANLTLLESWKLKAVWNQSCGKMSSFKALNLPDALERRVRSVETAVESQLSASQQCRAVCGTKSASVTRLHWNVLSSIGRAASFLACCGGCPRARP
eukprot:2413849-Amphidinium_carterae.1